jgi:hypothetical protein
MKLSVVLALTVACACLVGQSQAFFGGLGLGLGGLGFGGFGLGFGGFGLARLALLSRFALFGKRSVDSLPQIWNGQNKTVFTYVPESSVIRADSGEQKFDCEVEARLDAVKDITIRLPWLNMLPEVVKQSGSDVHVIRLYSRVTGVSTFINPKTSKDITLSIYSSPIVQEPGWFVKDVKCYEKIDSVVSALGVEGVKFAIDIERS